MATSIFDMSRSFLCYSGSTHRSPSACLTFCAAATDTQMYESLAVAIGSDIKNVSCIIPLTHGFMIDYKDIQGG